MNINDIITYRFKDQLFSLSIKSLCNINNKLGLSNRTSKEANCVQIVKELIERYHYVGVYDSSYISEFIKLHSDAFSNEDTFERSIAQIKLNDLILKPETNDYYNQLITIDEPSYFYQLN